MSAPSAGGTTQSWLERLGKALAHLGPECDTTELSRRVVEAAHTQFGMPGVRLWRVQDGAPAIWQSAGAPAEANEEFILGALSGKSPAQSGGNRWVCALPGDGKRAAKAMDEMANPRLQAEGLWMAAGEAMRIRRT